MIKNTLDHIALQQSPKGHFNFIDDAEPNEDEDDYPVHFCHGAPGAIPLFIEAHKTFHSAEYLQLAMHTGECVWKYGLLRKGYGLCHGICGNSYLLMSLFKITNDEVWR